jgi:flagellar basal body-associated protein FliL
MLLEGGGVFVATRYMSSGPLDAKAEAAAEADEKGLDSQSIEVPVVDFDAPNRKDGRLFVYTIEVGARIGEADADRFKKLVERHKLTLEDRLTNIVRAAAPEVLAEDGLETLRRQFQAEMSKVFNDEGVVQEVLFPVMMPHRADY